MLNFFGKNLPHYGLALSQLSS